MAFLAPLTASAPTRAATCAPSATGNAGGMHDARCSARGRYPGLPGCPVDGCTLVEAVANGKVSRLSVFNQALGDHAVPGGALRACSAATSQTPVASDLRQPEWDRRQPDGSGRRSRQGRRAGRRRLPTSVPRTAMKLWPNSSPKKGGVLAEERSTVPFPITPVRPDGHGVLVTGPGAQYTIADPTDRGVGRLRGSWT